jgi:glycosyltransferase involved in cell wall biosynthesis
MLRAEGNFSPSLVIAGRKGWLYDRIFSEVSSSGLRDAVTFTGYVPDEDLVALYSMARVFVYPSLYEGFGLPCIEAMACGCPVVTSNRGALLEVTGSAALHAEPEDVSSLAAAIRKACEDEGLRERLIRSGLGRCRLFSWETYGEEVLKAVEGVVHEA